MGDWYVWSLATIAAVGVTFRILTPLQTSLRFRPDTLQFVTKPLTGGTGIWVGWDTMADVCFYLRLPLQVQFPASSRSCPLSKNSTWAITSLQVSFSIYHVLHTRYVVLPALYQQLHNRLLHFVPPYRCDKKGVGAWPALQKLPPHAVR